MLASGRSLLVGVIALGFGGALVLWLAGNNVASGEDTTGAGMLFWLANVAFSCALLAVLLWFAVDAVTEESERSFASLAAEQRKILEQLAALERSLAEHAAPASDTVEVHREATTDVDPGHLRP